MEKILSRIFGALIIIGSQAVLLLLGRRENFLTWIIVIVSIILFIIGAAIISHTYDKPFGKVGSVVRKILLCVYGGLLVYIACRALVSENFSNRSIVIFTMLLIEGIAAWVLAFSISFNAMLDGMQIVDGMKDEIPALYAKFKDVETPFGRPWVGTINPGDMRCLIYGPTEDGSFLYGFYEMGTFFFGENDNDQFIDKAEVDKHRINRKIGGMDSELGNIYNLAAMVYPVKYKEMFEHYVKTGEARWLDEADDSELTGKVYVFDEKVNFIGQTYHLVDKDGNHIYDLKGTLPLKNFYIRDSRDGSEIFRISKRLLHIFPHYDFYNKGEKYGSMSQEMKFTHDIFSMKTRDGKLLMKQVNATIGDNYAVYMNDRLIGTLSEKISFRIRDIIFDNFVLMVFDERYRALLTALAIMAEREQVRDRAGVI